MQMDANPLLDFSGLPRFAAVRPEHIAPAIDQLLADNRALIDRLTLTETPATWAGFAQPLEDANERLGRAWGVVGHLHAVLDSPELREAYKENQPKVVQYWTALGQNLALFEKYKALRAGPEFERLTRAQKKIVENEIRDFRLSGAELPPEKKQRYAEIQEESAKLATKFAESALDSTNAFAVHIEERAALAGIPDDVLEAARAAAEKDGRSGWRFVLHIPSYLPVMQYAENRSLREIMYRGSVTRASEAFAAAFHAKAEFEQRTNGKAPADAPASGAIAGWDNTPLIARILALRREAAQLLGYATFAEVSLVPKMAEHPQQVLDFLEDLAARARPYGERDWAELGEFAAAELGLDRVEAWDIAFASERLRQARYAFSDQEVKQYFPEPKVLAGMFRLVETLYGIRIEEDQAETWDPSVRFFRITDGAGELVGQFYLDPYARATKRGGAWMDEAMTRRLTQHGLQRPVAYLVCNFSAPVGEKPALLTHDDVLTLFHEFGHGLHHLLTKVESLGVSGIRGVEWDAVELPSQFMENFCWEWDVVRHMSAHVDTGALVAARALRQDARGEELPVGPADAAAARVRALRHASAFGFRPGGRNESARAARRGAPQGGGLDPAGLQPLPQHVLAHLRRGLQRGLLQLQMGRGALGRRVQPVRGEGRARLGDRRALPRRDPRRRRQPAGDRVVPRVPRPRADGRGAPAAQRDDGHARSPRIGVHFDASRAAAGSPRGGRCYHDLVMSAAGTRGFVMKKLAIAVAAMLVAATASAQMYRWVDKDGKVYYTDTPPPAAAKSVQKRADGAGARPTRVPPRPTRSSKPRRTFRSSSTRRRTAGSRAPTARRCSRRAACRTARSRSAGQRLHRRGSQESDRRRHACRS